MRLLLLTVSSDIRQRRLLTRLSFLEMECLITNASACSHVERQNLNDADADSQTDEIYECVLEKVGESESGYCPPFRVL